MRRLEAIGVDRWKQTEKAIDEPSVPSPDRETAATVPPVSGKRKDDEHRLLRPAGRSKDMKYAFSEALMALSVKPHPTAHGSSFLAKCRHIR